MAKFLTISLTLLLLFACTTSDTGKGSQDKDVQEAAGAVSESKILESLRADIITGAPDTLQNVYDAASTENLADSERAGEYKYIAWKLMMILYPEKAKPLEPVLPPAYSDFPHIFDEAEQGRLVSVEAEDINYLTLLLPTLVLIYTDDKATIANALENLNEANKLNPLSPSVLPTYISGFYYERTGDYKQAEQEYEKTLFINDLVYPARFGLYRIYINSGRIKEAGKLENRLAGDLFADADYQYFYATRLIESGDVQKSYNQTEHLIKNYPENRDYLLLRARQYVRLNRPQQALPILDALSKQRYTKPAGYYLAYCKTLRLLEQNDKALEIIRKGLEFFPDNESLKIEYGKILIVTGEVEEGRALISGDPGEDDSIIEGKELLMEQAMKSGDWVSAELVVLELLKNERKDEYILNAAIIYRELGLNRDALRYIEEIYKKSDDPTILPEYIEILLQAGQDDKVFSLINEGLEKIDDSRIRSKLYVYKSHFSLVRTERLRNLTYAKLEDSTNVEALLLLADYFIEIGDKEQALSNLRDAALIEPDNLLIKEKIEKLE